ncbi:hypothetical protein VUR80DRAFT_5996 [Thermomyces stellatus]
MEEESEKGSPQTASVEAQKRRRQEAETDGVELEGDAAVVRHSKRARTDSPESESAETGKNGVIGKSEASKSESPDGCGSEEGEVDEEQEREATSGDKTEKGEIHTSSPADEYMDSSDSEDSSDGEHAQTAASNSSPSSTEPRMSGWNKGISSVQVQTSLSSVTQKAPTLPVLTASKAPKETSSSPQSSPPPLGSSISSTSSSHFQKSGISLKLPPPGDRNAGESWQVRFQNWTGTLLKLNPEQVPVVTPELILDAYNYFIDRVCRIHNKKKKAAKAGAELFSQKGSLSRILGSARGEELPDPPPREEVNGSMSLSNSAGRHEPRGTVQSQNVVSLPDLATAAAWEFGLESKPAPQTSTNETKEMSLNGASSERPQQNGSPTGPPPTPPPPPPFFIPSGDEELKLQQKYFPRFNESMASAMCVLCLQHGHHASSCPNHNCKHCGARYQHNSYACPSKLRCGRCKGFGHVVEDCTNDEVTGDEEDALKCAHCDGTDHYEKDCDVLWRTYRIPDSPNKCHSIYATCASCGEDGHYFFDCEAGRLRFPKPRTWCEENRVRYLDKASKRGPLSDVKPEPLLRRPELVGRSNENIYFESDDSEGEALLIGNRVQPKKSVGRINVSSNIQFGGQVRSSQGDAGLPSSASLPPRPQSYADTLRSETRQQDNGRRQHQLPPRPPATSRGGTGNYQAVPPPPGLQRNPSQGGGDNSNGNSSRGGRKNSRGGKGGGRGNGRSGNPRSNRGGGKWH